MQEQLHNIEEKTNEELFELYKATGSQRVKQEIVLRYIYIVKNVAFQMKGVYASFTQMDDIINESVIVLMNSVDKFDPEANVKFETYISKRLRGLIIDMARKQDWIPRTVRKNARMIDDATNELYSKLGRFPTNEEMAEHLGVSLDKYENKMLSKTNLYNLISLDAFIEGQSQSNNPINIPDNGCTPEQIFESKEVEDILKKAVESLRKNEQMVLSLRYRKELSSKEIATVMNLSESRISQIHANALRKLRIYMQENLED